MITLHKQKLLRSEDKVILSASFELDGQTEELWYSFPSKYEKYLIVEQLDAFVIGLLFLGLKKGKDIKLNGSLSARLYYAINHYLIDALCLANSELKRIKIIPESLSYSNHNEIETAGTGLSCGIDSFTTYYEHIEEKKPYRIDYFTFFNVGSHGDLGGERARKIFESRFQNVREFSQNENKALITVDSNISEVLEMKFMQTYNLRTISCVLHLQKLFKNYYYSSGTRFDHFAFNKHEIADLDMLVIPNLSTESTSIFVSALKYSRIERTNLISDFPQTYDHLDVCTDPFDLEREKINCSRCYKCMRTMLTLELLGKLENYASVFDVSYFKRNKERHIGWLLSKPKKLTLDKELLDFLKKRGNISSRARLYKFKNLIYRKRINFLKSIRH